MTTRLDMDAAFAVLQEKATARLAAGPVARFGTDEDHLWALRKRMEELEAENEDLRRAAGVLLAVKGSGHESPGDLVEAILAAARGQLVAMLAEVEWRGSQDTCLWCGEWRVSGHADDCHLAAALGRS